MMLLCIPILMGDKKKQEVANNLSSQRKVVEATSPMFDFDGAIKAPNYINCHIPFHI